MKINYPFRMNDWNIKQFIIAILVIQATSLLVIGLELDGYNLSIMRQIVLFVYIKFIPGILILKTLKIHRLCSAVIVVYVVGVNLSILMLTGLLLNMFLPMAGFDKEHERTEDSRTH